MKENKSNKQSEKARLGAMGENLVTVKLMQKGWDAFNANCSIKNYKSIDIVCFNSNESESAELWWKPKSALIQVKTSVENNIPVGFSLKEAIDKDYLWKMVKGPYVFVSAKKDKISKTYSFQYFIISRRLFVELVYNAHNYYVNVLHKNDNIELNAPAGFNISWLKGKPEFSSVNRTHFGNPLTETCENKWMNIWEE